MKRLLLFFLTLWVGVFAQAQITRAIWGLSLGVATANDVRIALREKGYAGQMDESTYGTGDRSITVNAYPMRFGGCDWNRASFTIRNGLLESVAFSCNTNSSGLYTAKNLYSSLEKKYSRYKLGKYPWDTYKKIDYGNGSGIIFDTDFAVCFRDGRTQIVITHSK